MDMSQPSICNLPTTTGVFVYPLAEAEAEVVSGFEAEASGRRVSFQLQSRHRSPSEPCCRELRPEAGLPRRCAQGEGGENGRRKKQRQGHTHRCGWIQVLVNRAGYTLSDQIQVQRETQ